MSEFVQLISHFELCDLAVTVLGLDRREAGLGPECRASYQSSMSGTFPLISTVIVDEYGQHGDER